MPSTSLAFCISLTLLGIVSTCHAETYLETAYSEVNPDWKPYANGEGIRILGKLELPHSFYLFGSYNTATLKTSGPLSAHGKAENWRIAGAGWAFPIASFISLHGGASYQGVRTGSGYHDGMAVHAGFHLTPMKWAFLELDVGYLDLLVDDISLEATLGVRPTEKLAITVRIHDHSEWDFTAYEAGLRLYF